MTHRQCSLLLIVAISLTSASAAVAQAVVLDRVVAVVGDSPVLLSDVRLLVEFQLVEVPPGVDPEQAALDRLIERRLMFEEVDRYGPLEPDPARVAERLAEVTSRLGDRLDRAYARTGINEGRLRSLVVQLLRIDDYVEQRFGAAAQPTDDEVARFYAEQPGPFTVDGRVRPFAEVEAEARALLMADRRTRLVREWVHSIERRTPVRVIQ